MSDDLDKELADAVEDLRVTLYGADNIEFEVVCKVRAIRGDGKIVDGLFDPILLYSGDSLYRAMFIMAMACEVEEFQVDMEQLGPVAAQVAERLRAGEFEWEKAK